MNNILKNILLLLIVDFQLAIINAQSVSLNTIGFQPDFPVGLSWGVPFAKGEVKMGENFVLLNSKNVEIPLQYRVLAYHPDGSVKWMGFDAAVDAKDRFVLKKSEKPLPFEGIKTIDNKDFIEINNGKFVCRINKQGSEIIKNISIDGAQVVENGILRASLEHRNGNNINFEDYVSEIKEVSIEQQGNVRTLVKVEGKYKSLENGRKFLPFTLRIYFYQNIDNLRIVHSFAFDGEQSEDFIKSLGMSFDLPLCEQPHNRHIRFASADGGLWSEAVTPLVSRSGIMLAGQWNLPQRQSAGERLPDFSPQEPRSYATFNHLPRWNDFKLTQLTAGSFTIKKRTNDESSWLFSNQGKRAAGLVLAGDVSGGIAVAQKDFWQSFPASLEMRDAASEKAQVAVWFWSPDGEAMDLRHYDTIAHDLDATYEDVQPGLSTPYGIARTTEITVFPFSELPSREKTLEMADYVSKPALLACTPVYLHSKRAFGVWSLPDKFENPTAKWIENQLDSAFLFYHRAIAENSWYGFWNYGDVMHSYDISRHTWRYDVGGFAWDNTELAPNNWLWYSFLRSGREDIFRVAEAMTRHTGEVDAYHLGDMKGLGSRHNVSHWGDGAKEARIGQAAWKRYYYYLTTDERCGDLMRESLDVEKSLMIYEPLRVAQPRDKFPFNAPTRLRWGPDWLALAGNWFTEWERTGDKICRDKILAGMKSLAKLPNNLFTGPGGLGYDPETSTFSYDGAPNVTNKNHLSTIMGGYEILLEIFDNIDYKPFRKVFTEYARYYSMPPDDADRTEKTKEWGNIGFRNPRLAAFAAKELGSEKLAQRAWNEFLLPRSGGNETKSLPNLYGSRLVTPPEVLNQIHENPAISTNSVSQWSINAIVMLELIGDKLPIIQPRKKLFEDDFTGNWQEKWLLDGEQAELKNTPAGLIFSAGKTPASDAAHSVLWTKQSFEGDLQIEFDFVKRDTMTKFVNIIYLFAEGSGDGEFKKDISLWKDLRKIPAMQLYYNHINTFHISFAAFENYNSDPEKDYIRARLYRPESGKGLEGTDILPENLNTGLFLKDVRYHFTITRIGTEISLTIAGGGKTLKTGWKLPENQQLSSGKIGLRLMGGRISEFSNFIIFKL